MICASAMLHAFRLLKRRQEGACRDGFRGESADQVLCGCQVNTVAAAIPSLAFGPTEFA